MAAEAELEGGLGREGERARRRIEATAGWQARNGERAKGGGLKREKGLTGAGSKRGSNQEAK
jgi:hypothetical protein